MWELFWFFCQFSSERGLDIPFSLQVPSANPSGVSIGWVWTACHLSHAFIPFHISVFSEVASFPSLSLLGCFLSAETCPQSAPVACARTGHASLVSAGVRGQLVGVARLHVTPFVPLLPGVSRWGFMFPSMNHLGVEGEGLCSVPDTILSSLEN